MRGARWLLPAGKPACPGEVVRINPAAAACLLPGHVFVIGPSTRLLLTRSSNPPPCSYMELVHAQRLAATPAPPALQRRGSDGGSDRTAGSLGKDDKRRLTEESFV